MIHPQTRLHNYSESCLLLCPSRVIVSARQLGLLLISLFCGLSVGDHHLALDIGFDGFGHKGQEVIDAVRGPARLNAWNVLIDAHTT